MSNRKSYILAIISGIIAGTGSAVVLVGLLMLLLVTQPDKVANWLSQNQVSKDNGSVTEQIEQVLNTTEVITQEEVVVETVKQVKPAVVSIIITKDVPVYEEYYEDYGYDPFFGPFGQDQFLFQQPQLKENGTEEQEIGGGSGFIASADGYVVTNKHVVEDAGASYTVFTNEGDKYEAKVIARDPLNDVAVLKIEATNLSFLEFGDSDQLQVGQTAIAIGNALGEFSNSVSVGVVSGLSRSIVAGDGFGQSEELENVIQTDAAVNSGNSGGPLLNLGGEVIGVNVAVAYGSENIGFALPANLVKQVVNSVRENGKIVRPHIGVRYVEITAELKEANNLSVDYGALIARGDTINDLAVIPGSPADKAGLRENDIILEIDEQKLDEDHSLSRIVSQKSVGDTIDLKILRQGEEQTLKVILEERPAD